MNIHYFEPGHSIAYVPLEKKHLTSQSFYVALHKAAPISYNMYRAIVHC
jgi:hypothetical protein